MSIRKALLAGIAAAALVLTAACEDAPADTPSVTRAPTLTTAPATPTAVAPTPAEIRPQEWAVVADARPLHEAVIAGSWADVERALDEGADVNATATVEIHTGHEVSGLTPLHLASALNDDPEVALLLLDRGGDIGTNDEAGYTPLHLASALNGNPEVAALLLDRGADIEAKDD